MTTYFDHHHHAPIVLGAPERPTERHALADYEVTHIQKWKPAEVLAVFGLVAFMGRWVWKYAVRPVTGFFHDLASMPKSVKVIRKKQDEIGQMVIMARSRAYALFDSATHPIWESNGAGQCVFCNTAMLAVLGLPFEAIAGDNWRSIVHFEDRDEVTTEWEKAVSEHRDFQMEYRWVGANNRLIGIRANARRIMDGENVIGYIANVKIIH